MHGKANWHGKGKLEGNADEMFRLLKLIAGGVVMVRSGDDFKPVAELAKELIEEMEKEKP